MEGGREGMEGGGKRKNKRVIKKGEAREREGGRKGGEWE